MPLPLFIPFPQDLTGGFTPQYPVMKWMLNVILELNPPLLVNEKPDLGATNALNEFKARLFRKI
jgi:hypothetical protein